VTSLVLQYYDVSKPAVIQCDASSSGIGACIMQEDNPVEYASKTMTPTERDTFARSKKEMYAILYSLDRFHTYVYARHVTIETDHKPLISIVEKSLASAPKRLQRMLLRQQRYNFTLIFRPGSQMLIADTISRAPVEEKTPRERRPTDFEDIAALTDEEQQQALRMVASQATIELIKSAAATDDQYQLLQRQIETGWPVTAADLPPVLTEFTTFADELAESDGLVFKGQRVVMPVAARAEILQRIHSCHTSVSTDAYAWRRKPYFIRA